MKRLRVTVDGRSYDVLVEVLDEGGAPPLPAAPTMAAPHAASAAPTVLAAPAAVASVPSLHAAPSAPAGDGAVTSPLAGKVVSVDVRVGETIAEGAQVVTLEAMKMNTFVYASRAGRVVAVHAAAGDVVEEGGLLVSLG